MEVLNPTDFNKNIDSLKHSLIHSFPVIKKEDRSGNPILPGEDAAPYHHVAGELAAAVGIDEQILGERRKLACPICQEIKAVGEIFSVGKHLCT